MGVLRTTLTPPRECLDKAGYSCWPDGSRGLKLTSSYNQTVAKRSWNP